MQEELPAKERLKLDPFYYLVAEGEMASLIREYNWSQTYLGNPTFWPQSLKTTLGIMINSKFPMFLFWGEELLCFYNDGYRPSLGNKGKHPDALGKPGALVWPETWAIITPLIEQVLNNGQSSWSENQLLPIYRNGKMEDVYWTFSYSPVHDESGKPAGVFVTCFETTEKVAIVNDLVESKEELSFAIEATELGTWDLDPQTNRFKANDRLKDWFGLLPSESLQLQLAISSIHEKDRVAVIAAIRQALIYESGGLYDIEYTIVHPVTLQERIVKAKGKAWFTDEKIAFRFNGTLQDITASQKAIIQQQEATELLESVLDASMVSISVLKAVRDSKGEITDFRYQLANKVSEMSNNNIPLDGRLVSDVNAAYKPAGIMEDFLAVMKSGLMSNAERHIIAEGMDKWYATAVVKLGDGVVFSFRDITTDVLARTRLIESEARLRNIIEEAPVATCLFVGPEMRIELANDIMIGYWGKGRTVIGKSLAEGLPEIMDQEFPGILDEIYKTGIAYEALDARADLVVNGIPRTYYFDFAYKPLFDANGQVYAIVDMAIDVTDRFLGRKKIDEIQQRLLASFEQSPVAIAMLSSNELTFKMANPFYEQLVGRSLNELYDKPFLEAMPELKGQGFDEKIYNVINSGEPFVDTEVPVSLIRNGKTETIYVDLTIQPQLARNRETSGVLIVATDVTQQVLSRRKVEASEARFRFLVQQAPIPTCLFSGPGMILELANEAMLNSWGKDSSILGKPYKEILPELQVQDSLDILDEVYNSGNTYEAKASQVKLNRKGIPETFYFDFTYKPLFDNEEKVYAIICMAVDVTEEVLGRQKIEKAEASLRSAIELAQLATWSLDIKNSRMNYSQRFMDWLGFTEDSKSIDESYNPLPASYRKPVAEAIAAVIKPGSPGIYESEHPVINQLSGQERIIHAHAQVFYDTEGNPAYLAGTAQDVTEQRRMQYELELKVEERTAQLAAKAAELVEANKALQQTNMELNEFAYVASHDLQEPLRKVRTFAELLESHLENIPGKAQMYIDKIQLSTQRMQNLINDVLKFSLLSQERENFEKVDLNIIAQHILSDYELMIEQKNVTVTVAQLPVLNAIKLQMSQLFTNLISNALKFSSPERALVINISCRQLKGTAIHAFPELHTDKIYYQFEFKDNGIGFNQENAIQIFTIFQRLHNKNEYEGTGIGLALCKKIVANHHGIIYANSEKGEGSKFVIILPETIS